MAKRIVTQEDLDLNPDLVDAGVKVGDEIDIPETEQNEQAPTDDDDTGGTQPPPGKKRP